MSKTVDILTTAICWAMEGASFKEVANKLKELDEVKVKVYRESEDVKLPTYAKYGDVCMDIYVHSIEYKSDGRVVYHTGLHFRLPEDYEMEIRPRSSNTKTMAVIQNSPGTLDGGYTGEMLVIQRNIDDPEHPRAEYQVGDRCAQLLVRRRERIIWDEVKTEDELGTTERGSGGFGHTGR